MDISNNTTTVRYSDEELQEFKELIDDKLEKAQQELDFMREQILELNENTGDQQGGDWFDDSSIHTELEMLNNQVIRQQQFINNLKNALIRIQNKTYGICTVTGQLIDKKRLMLVPHATKSVAAKEEKPQPVEKEREDTEVIKQKVQEIHKPKLITKILRKPTKTGGKPKVQEDDFEDWDLLEDEDISNNEESGDINSPMLGMNFDDMADDDGME